MWAFVASSIKHQRHSSFLYKQYIFCFFSFSLCFTKCVKTHLESILYNKSLIPTGFFLIANSKKRHTESENKLKNSSPPPKKKENWNKNQGAGDVPFGTCEVLEGVVVDVVVVVDVTVLFTMAPEPMATAELALSVPLIGNVASNWESWAKVSFYIKQVLLKLKIQQIIKLNK